MRYFKSVAAALVLYGIFLACFIYLSSPYSPQPSMIAPLLSDALVLLSWLLLTWFLSLTLWYGLPFERYKGWLYTWGWAVFLAILWYGLKLAEVFVPLGQLKIALAHKLIEFTPNIIEHSFLLKLTEALFASLDLLIYLLIASIYLKMLLELLFSVYKDGALGGFLHEKRLNSFGFIIATLLVLISIMVGLNFILGQFYAPETSLPAGSSISNTPSWNIAWVFTILKLSDNLIISLGIAFLAIVVFLIAPCADYFDGGRFWRKSAVMVMSVFWLIASFIGISTEFPRWFGLWLGSSSHSGAENAAFFITLAWFSWFLALWPIACALDRRRSILE